MKKIIVILLVIVCIASLIVGWAFLRSKLMIHQLTFEMSQSGFASDPFPNQIRIGGLGKVILFFYAFALLAMGIVFTMTTIVFKVIYLCYSRVVDQLISFLATCGPGIAPLLI